MQRHWASRGLGMVVPMDVARGMWGRAWRVDTHVCERLGTRRATLLFCAERPGSEDCTPIGWCSMVWHPDDPREAVIDRLAWDTESGRTQVDAWRALSALLEEAEPEDQPIWEPAMGVEPAT